MPASPRAELNVIGYVSSATGLGVSARNLIRALLGRGIDISALDLDLGGGRGGADNRFAHLCVARPQDLPQRHNFFVMPAHAIAAHADELQALMLRDGCLNAAFPVWELPQIPEADRLVLQTLDVAVSSSDFIRYAFDFGVPGLRTVRGMQPLALPSATADRQRFGLPAHGVVFVFAFEPLSCLARKNPYAVIDAFIQGVGAQADAHLLIKLNNPCWNGKALPAVTELRERVAAHPRIRIIAETLDYADVMALFASCDVFVSLHRAEGFGLGLLEAMLLGKPVIATAWSGNMSFMSERSACLVGHRLIPTRGTVMQYRPPYIPGTTVWAEPSVDEAAAWMQRLLHDEALRQRKGEAARHAARAYCAEAEQCAFIDDIAALAEHIDPAAMAARHAQLPARLPRIQALLNPVSPVERVRRAWRKLRAPLDRHLLWRFKPQPPAQR